MYNTRLLLKHRLLLILFVNDSLILRSCHELCIIRQNNLLLLILLVSYLTPIVSYIYDHIGIKC